MKTLEQTVRSISVGLATLATTALLVMVTAATLFCGVTSARAQEPDNRIDWRWGRPGVMVVTNAPTAVTVTNIATEVATEVAGGVANTMFGPRVTALEDALDGGTNNWNTAYGWGDHAGLYKAIGWVPSWTDVTDKPDLFDWSYDSLTDVPTTFPPEAHRHDYTAITNAPWLTEYTETDEIALAALYGTNTILEAAITNEVALRTAHTEDTGNPHDVTAAQIGAITVEQDLAARRAYHYGSPDIVESPAEWFVFNGAGTITAFNWEVGRENVVIPWAIGGVPVTAIETRAFQMSGITSVIAPQTVTSIGDSAFANCYSLASVTIPDSVTSIENYTFTGCSSLTSVIIPNSVTSIGSSAFSGCADLTSVTIPDSVTSIENYTFTGCSSLTSVIIGNSVTSIGDYTFSGCTSLTSVTIPDSVTSIENYAFVGCSSLTSVIIGNSVTSIGDYTFSGCTSLTSVTLNNDLSSFRADQVFNTSPITHIVIGNSVTSIGDWAFAFCFSLTSVYFDGNAPTIGPDIFSGLPANQVTNYVTNPQATGWGEKLGGMPVVRMPVYGDEIYKAGELVATTGHVAQAIAAIEFPVTSTNYTAWTGTITPADGTATVTIAHGNMPVLVTAAPCVLTLDPTGYGTAGVSRVSLSYYTGTNSFTFATNIIDYAETPTVDTNGWNSLLIRRVSNGAWKGVGL